jgi:hypothetical protein
LGLDIKLKTGVYMYVYISMKVFYTASYAGKQKYQKHYDQILEALERQPEVEVISPEKGNYKNTLSLREMQKIGDPKKIHYEAIRRGIGWADAVIIEMSNEDFQLGHEATLAMQGKKHVLCLSIFEDFSEKILNRYFHGAKYTELTVDELIDDFVDKARKELLIERFNCFLSISQVQHLEGAARDHGVNMSEYLRILIDADRKTPIDIQS